jgi:hypothetical protein
MIIRTYGCLNRNCQHEFTSDGDFPPCPRCRGIRVKWVPGAFNVGGKGNAKDVDAIARGLADDYKLTNFRTPEVGRSAVALPQGNGKTAGTFEPQQGWKIPMPESALTGQGHAVCAPTGVTAKVTVNQNQVMPASKTLGAGSRIEGSFRPPGGIPK